jgi:hypothetical protein
LAVHEKYCTSLTEQEIIHGLPGYRPGPGSGLASSSEADSPADIAYIREIAGGSAAANPRFIKEEPRLDALKARSGALFPKTTLLLQARGLVVPEAISGFKE